MKGIIYYTDNRINDPIKSVVRQYILASGLPIVSTSLYPIDFGTNYVIDGQRSYPTMVKQILTALEKSVSKYVFFCEHDVLYPKSHFDFTPQEDNIFYYNENVWRWKFWKGTADTTAIRYDKMLPLSCLCVNREYAYNHYKLRWDKIMEMGLQEFRSREPRMARIWGYEPGTKLRRRGGFTDDICQTWSSDIPVIDIRHQRTFSRLKCTMEDFKHAPTGWIEIPISEIKGWDLKTLFNL